MVIAKSLLLLNQVCLLFEKEYIQHLKTKFPDLLKEIAKKRELTSEIVDSLKNSLEDFHNLLWMAKSHASTR